VEKVQNRTLDRKRRARPSVAQTSRRIGGLTTFIIVAGVVSIGVFSCLVAVGRGIDLTDESYYLVLSLHPKTYLRSSTEFQLFAAPVLWLVRYVWLLRALNLLSLVMASGVFAFAFLRTAPSLMAVHFRRSDRLTIGVTIIAGALMPSVYLPQTPGYNQFTMVVLFCASSLMLLLADLQVPRSLTPLAWAIVGALIWAQVLIKWPATMAMIPLLAFSLWHVRNRAVGSTKSALFILGGALFAAFLTSVLVVPLPRLIVDLKLGSKDAATFGGHGATGLVSQYLLQLRHLSWVILSDYWYLLVVAIFCGAITMKREYVRPVAWFLGIGFSLLTPVMIISGRARGGVAPWATISSRGSVLPTYVLVALFLGAATFGFSRPMWPAKKVLVLCALLVMPFLSAIGTSNYLWFNASFAATFWIAAAMLVISRSFEDYSHLVIRGLAIAFATLISFTAIDGTWENPYRQQPLSNDSVSIAGPGLLSGLKVDAPTATFIKEVRSAVRATNSRRPPILVALTGIAGASVAGNMVQPIFAWITGPTPATLVLTASCKDQSRGILLLQFPGNPQPSKEGLPSQCSNRTWIKFADIDVPLEAGIGSSRLETYFAPPIS